MAIEIVDFPMNNGGSFHKRLPGGKTMPCLPPDWLGMVSLYHLYIYGDDWGTVYYKLLFVIK